MTYTDPASLPAERLALLARLTHDFSSSLDLDEVLNRVVDEVIAALHAERGFVMLHEPGGTLTFRVARGMDQTTIQAPGFQVSRGVVERVAAEGRPVRTDDAQHDDRFSMRQSILSLGVRSILCAPLVVRGGTIGVLYVDNRLQAGIFTPADLDLLAAIASSAAIAVENARLYQAAVEKGRLERELQMARELQIGLLPQAPPKVPGWELVASWRAARQVAGDFYDFICLPDGRVGIVIADVADKGMPAAFFMALTRTTVRASVIAAASPAEAISRANRLICADATGGMFVTLFYAEINAATGALTYVNAGHNPGVLCRGELQSYRPLERTGLLLGMDENAAYEQRVVQLEPDDLVLLYTDGVTEASSADSLDDMFGEERLHDLMAQRGDGTAAEIVASLDRALLAFTGPVAPLDDVTVVAVKRV